MPNRKETRQAMQAQPPTHSHEPVGLLWIGDATDAVVHFARRAPHVRVAQSDATSMVAALQSGATDLLVLDATLDGIDVSAVLGHLQAAQLDTPVLLLARPGGEDLAIQAGRFVVCDCVVKTADYLLQLLPAIGQLRARHDLVALFRTNRQSQDRLRTILEFQPAVTCVIGPDGIITAMNRAGLTLLGAARDQVVGRPFASLLPDESRHDASAFIRRVCQGEAADVEHVVLRDGRQPLAVRTRAVPFRNGDTVVALATVQERQQHAPRQREPQETAADLAQATAALHAVTSRCDVLEAERSALAQALESLQAQLLEATTALSNERSARAQQRENATWQHPQDRHQIASRSQEPADLQQPFDADYAAMLKLRDDLLRFMADADSQCRAIIEQHEARLAPNAFLRNQSFT
ncbi:MAG: PAS domain-containing protein [Vicinamibacterales bacterium]